MPELPRFHLAVPVDDLAAARRFYGEVLGCPPGRSAATWADWDLRGHQLVTHLVARPAEHPEHPEHPEHHNHHNAVDGDDVPVPHFGLVLSPVDFTELADRLRANGVEFVIEPHVRFAGQVGEQWTMFLTDPAGNALEFKAFRDDGQVFAAAG